MAPEDRATPLRDRPLHGRPRRAVVMGASAGGIEAMRRLFARLPERFPAPVFVVLHLPEHSNSALPQILTRAGPLVARHAVDGQRAVPGRVYVAPPDRHLTVEDGVVRVSRGAKEHGHRPAIDPLFRSAAQAFGRGVVGVMLSGALDDGTAGLLAVKSRGGIAIVQDPQDASHSGMPLSAIQNVPVDRILPVDRIGPAIVESLSALPPPLNVSRHDRMAYGSGVAKGRLAEREGELPGTPSTFACPECGGVLWALKDGELERYRCRVGHAYSPESLGDAQTRSIEAALWTALRALREKASLRHRMAERAKALGHRRTAHHFDRSEDEILGQARMIQELLEQGERSDEPPDESEVRAVMGELSGS